jgi:hypothetical protein
MVLVWRVCAWIGRGAAATAARRCPNSGRCRAGRSINGRGDPVPGLAFEEAEALPFRGCWRSWGSRACGAARTGGGPSADGQVSRVRSCLWPIGPGFARGAVWPSASLYGLGRRSGGWCFREKAGSAQARGFRRSCSLRGALRPTGYLRRELPSSASMR